MPRTPSIMGLHLRYRLWIAEMNLDINVLRIFNDYVKELESKKNLQEVKTKIDYFQEQFINLRKEIDELRHEMQIIKMKLAAYSREMKVLNYKTYQADNHNDLKKRYFAFRKMFDKVKNEFRSFEGEWLH
jgi:uncharacterized coiled-coil DUF342 family protein